MPNIVKYKSRDGQDLELSFEIIRKYLITGNKQYVTDQELVYFMSICKSRRLNPFKKDCYLIKYSQNDPAAIIVSRDYWRSRARSQPDCKGWKTGIIVRDKEGKIKDSYGLLLEGETLLGGFFEAKPDGWNETYRLEVNLNGYIKKTRDGHLTRFWQSENQPTQIAKVAESQGLRALWPDEFQGLYADSEIGIQDNNIDYIQAEDTGETKTVSFEDQLPNDIDEEILDQFIQKCIENNKEQTGNDITIEDVKAEAAQNMQFFLKAFDQFRKNREKSEKKPKTEKKKEAKEKHQVIEQEDVFVTIENNYIYSKLQADKKMFPETFKEKVKALRLPGIIDELSRKEAMDLHEAISASIDKKNY